ncbi:alpha-(1-_6)-mannopyranosyltransferase A [Rhodococcus aerolatus]
MAAPTTPHVGTTPAGRRGDAGRGPVRADAATPWPGGLLRRARDFSRTRAGAAARLGLLGSGAVLLGGLGAGSVRVRDPLLEAGHLSWLRYGHGHDLSVALVYLGVGLMLLAWVRLGRLVLTGRVDAAGLRLTVAAWVVPLLAAPPMFSRDAYSYLAQGALLRDGFDPYAVGPVANPGVLLDNVSNVWTTTTAPYGPVFLLMADGVTSLTGDDVVTGTILLRLLMLPGLLMLLWALPRLTAHLGGQHTVALWVAVLNPLVLVHLVGGVHNEMLMVGLLAAGLALALDRHHAAGIAVIAVGAAVKATAGVALPFVVWIWMAHRAQDRRRLRQGEAVGQAAPVPSTGSRRTLAEFARTAGPGAAVVVAVFGAASLVAGVGVGWLGALSGSAKIINWLSVPTILGHLVTLAFGWLTGVRLETVLPPLRALCGAVLGLVLLAVWWRSRGSALRAARAIPVALVAIVVLSPAALPWYYAWPLAMAAGMPWRTSSLVWVAGLSTWLVLVFRPAGDIGMYTWFDVVVATALAVLAARSLTRVDPLDLRRRVLGRPARDDAGVGSGP